MAGTCRRWDGRWAVRTAVALAPLGALAALVLVGLSERRAGPALVAYAVGALAVGLLGAALGGAAGLLRPGRTSRRRRAVTGWVVHRSGT